MKIAAAQSGKEDAFVAFSRSGSTKEIVETVAIAQVHQVKTMAITCYDSSPITENSDVNIIVPDKISVNNSALMSNHITFLFVVDLIMSIFISSDKTYLKKKLDSETVLASDQAMTNYYLCFPLRKGRFFMDTSSKPLTDRCMNLQSHKPSSLPSSWRRIVRHIPMLLQFPAHERQFLSQSRFQPRFQFETAL